MRPFSSFFRREEFQILLMSRLMALRPEAGELL